MSAYDRGYEDGYAGRKPVLSEINEGRNAEYYRGWDDGDSDRPSLDCNGSP